MTTQASSIRYVPSSARTYWLKERLYLVLSAMAKLTLATAIRVTIKLGIIPTSLKLLTPRSLRWD
jgi:hypothetical protein